MSLAPDSIAPGLLVAMPQLLEPTFRKAVILMASHGSDGAMGFVVNRKMSASVADIVKGLDIEWTGPANEPAWLGGPVSPESGWVLFDSETEDADSAEVLPGLRMSASLDCLRSLARKPTRRFRLLLGYTGWGSGQLESEIVAGSWLLVPPSPALIFDTPAERMWEEVYRGIGIDPSAIVPGGGVQ